MEFQRPPQAIRWNDGLDEAATRSKALVSLVRWRFTNSIDAYACGMRRIGKYFSYQVDALSEDQLIEYFTDLMASHSWSGSSWICTA